MDSVRLGIIGIGNMGTTHSKMVLGGEVPGLTLTAVADLKEDRRQWAADNLPGVQVFEDGSALIGSGACDAELIATPHYQHPTYAVEAFDKGLHVLSEKPAGVYTLQVREMNEAAAKSGKVFAMMFNQRTNCLYRKMHELVHSGSLGALTRVNWIITDWFRPEAYYKAGGWRATWAGEGGGVLVNQCPHQLDLLQWICGMPGRVHAHCHWGKWHDIEVEDDVNAYLEYPGGATGTFITSTGDFPGTNRLEITLERGKLVCENEKLFLYKLDTSVQEFSRTAKGGFDKPDFTVEEVPTDGENPQHLGVLKAFAGAILRGGPLVAPGSEGIRGVELSNAMHLSAWLGREVTLPLDEKLFLSELDKRRATSRLKEDSGAVFDTDGSY